MMPAVLLQTEVSPLPLHLSSAACGRQSQVGKHWWARPLLSGAAVHAQQIKEVTVEEVKLAGVLSICRF